MISAPPHEHEWRVLYVTRSHETARFYCIHCLKITVPKRIK